jgi:hypothetical protein
VAVNPNHLKETDQQVPTDLPTSVAMQICLQIVRTGVALKPDDQRVQRSGSVVVDVCFAPPDASIHEELHVLHADRSVRTQLSQAETRAFWRKNPRRDHVVTWVFPRQLSQRVPADGPEPD